jgi:hypothetical protein
MRAFLVFFFLSILSACSAVTPVAYDLLQDRQSNKLYKDIVSFFVEYPVDEVGACEHEQYTKFYRNSLREAYALQVRAMAIPGNEKAAQQYEILVGSIGRLRELHQRGCFSRIEIADMQGSFHSLFASIMRYELGKKYE